MGFTAWKTWLSSDYATYTDLNTYSRDNGRWLSHNATGGAPMCRVYNSGTISGISTGTAITFDSERFDVGTMHSTSSQTSRITVPTGGDGKYMIGGHARLDAAGSAANSNLILAIQLNGSTLIAADEITGESTSTRVWRLGPTTLYQLAAADYVELTVSYSNMTAVNVVAASANSPEMWAMWVGE